MLKRSHLAVALSLSALTLCGCGGAAQTPPEADAKDKRHQYEAAKADCMKQKGFQYVPYVRPTEPADEEERKRESGDYQAMQKYRGRYGFGVFAPYVYPKEVVGPGSTRENPDPNVKVQGSLSAAQLSAYHEAKDSCVVTASKDVLGLTVKSGIDYRSRLTLTHKRIKAAELDGDQELMKLSDAMATCLKGKGYKVSDTKPTAMDSRGENTFLELLDRMGEKEMGDAPEQPKMTKDTRQIESPALTAQSAEPYLTREVKAALDDLECGRDFYAAFLPKESALQRRVNDQFAF
jgi:predicted small lipoprotein YifL